MNADAALEFSRMDCQGFHVTFNQCEAEGFPLVRLGGSASHARAASKQNLPEGAKVGYSPCCTRATHVVAPPVRRPGDYSPGEAQGLAPWKKCGPCAPRRPAAHHFAESSGSSSTTRDGAAARLFLRAPGPLMCVSPSGVDAPMRAPCLRWAPTLPSRLFAALTPLILRPRPSPPPRTPRFWQRIRTRVPRTMEVIRRRHPLPPVVYVSHGIIVKDLTGRPLPPHGRNQIRGPQRLGFGRRLF